MHSEKRGEDPELWSFPETPEELSVRINRPKTMHHWSFACFWGWFIGPDKLSGVSGNRLQGSKSPQCSVTWAKDAVIFFLLQWIMVLYHFLALKGGYGHAVTSPWIRPWERCVYWLCTLALEVDSHNINLKMIHDLLYYSIGISPDLFVPVIKLWRLQ